MMMVGRGRTKATGVIAFRSWRSDLGFSIVAVATVFLLVAGALFLYI